MIFQMIIISISLSIDALGIGISYRLKGVTIQTCAKLIIGLISAGIMWLSLTVGEFVNRFLPGEVGNIVGICLLVLMGCIFIRNSLFGKDEAVCDIDCSKKIDSLEAVLLGITLSADSLSAGIAVAAVGMGNFMIPLSVGIMQVIFLLIGDKLVKNCTFLKRMDQRVCGVFSGLLLILIAVLRAL